MQDEEPDEDLTVPDTKLSPAQIQYRLDATVSRFQKLDTLEWYGRFAEDELLVSYLRRKGKVRNVVLASDSFLQEDYGICE